MMPKFLVQTKSHSTLFTFINIVAHMNLKMFGQISFMSILSITKFTSICWKRNDIIFRAISIWIQALAWYQKYQRKYHSNIETNSSTHFGCLLIYYLIFCLAFFEILHHSLNLHFKTYFFCNIHFSRLWIFKCLRSPDPSANFNEHSTQPKFLTWAISCTLSKY